MHKAAGCHRVHHDLYMEQNQYNRTDESCIKKDLHRAERAASPNHPKFHRLMTSSVHLVIDLWHIQKRKWTNATVFLGSTSEICLFHSHVDDRCYTFDGASASTWLKPRLHSRISWHDGRRSAIIDTLRNSHQEQHEDIDPNTCPR